MDPERKLAVVLAVAGALSFGVLYQGYVLLGGTAFDPLVLFVGMAVVAAVTTMLGPRLRRAIVSARVEDAAERGDDGR